MKMKSIFDSNALIINSGRVDPFNVLCHAIRRDQKSVVVIEEFFKQNTQSISSSEDIIKTIEILELALEDLRDRLK